MADIQVPMRRSHAPSGAQAPWSVSVAPQKRSTASDKAVARATAGDKAEAGLSAGTAVGVVVSLANSARWDPTGSAHSDPADTLH